MFKFLRIKCLSFITDRIQPQITAATASNHFSYLMLNEKNKLEYKNKAVQRRRNVSSSSSNQSKNRLKSSLDYDDKATDTIQVNSKTITFGVAAEK